MKRLTFVFVVLFTTLLAVLPMHAQGQFPNRPNGWVYDGINSLSAQQIDQINADGKALQAKTGISLVLATVNDCASDPQKYGTDLFNYWGIGNSQTNMGYLVLLCWNNGVKGSGRTVVSVPGAGLASGWPTSIRSQIVGMYIKPALGQDKSVDRIKSDGDLGVALVATYEEYVRRMTPVAAQPMQSQPVQPIVPVQPQSPRVDPLGTWTILGVNNPILVWIVVFITLIILLWVVIVLIRRWWRGQVTDDYDSPSPTYSDTHYDTSTYNPGPSYPRHHVYGYGDTTIVNNNTGSSGSGDFVTGMMVGENLANHHYHDDDRRDPAPAYTPPTEPHHDDSSPFDGGHASSSSDDNNSSPFWDGSTESLFGGGSAFGGGSTFSGGDSGGSSFSGGSAGGASSDSV